MKKRLDREKRVKEVEGAGYKTQNKKVLSPIIGE